MKRKFELKGNLGANPTLTLTVGNDGKQLTLTEGQVHETSDPDEIRELEASDAVKEASGKDKG
jgi:hypothetical protein